MATPPEPSFNQSSANIADEKVDIPSELEPGKTLQIDDTSSDTIAEGVDHTVDHNVESQHGHYETRQITTRQGKTKICKIVCFSTNDLTNPKNWSKARKWTVTLTLSWVCFAVAFASAVITPGISGVVERFDTSSEVALLTLKRRFSCLVYESRLERLEREVGRVMSLLPDNDRSSLASVPADSEAPPTSGAFSPNFEHPTDTMIYDIITVHQADLLVADYRDTFAAKFPYVIVPEGVTSLALIQTSPMLLLAILATSSWKLRDKQDHLNQVFLKALGTKLVLEGDRDMDLLRGLMVYLNWIHLHTTPKTQQAYRLAAIAASIAVEFGITKRPGKNKHQQLNVETINERPKGLSAVDAELWDPGARRAYLGCYQMTTYPLIYNDYLYICAQSLATANETPSDVDLVFHLEVAREADKAYTLFNYTDIQQTQFMGEQQIQVYLNAFSVKVQDWRLRFQSSLTQDPCQRIWPWLLEAFVRELCLSGMTRSTDFSMARIRILMDALTSAKGYFNALLAIPPKSIPSLPSTHWALLSYSILLTASISLSIQTQGWTMESARSIIKLDTYIDAISLRVKDLSLEMGSSEHLRNWYGDALAGWEAIKMRYLAACQESLSETDSYQQSAPSQVSPRVVDQSDDHGPRSSLLAQLQGDPSHREMAENSIRPSTGLEAFDFSADTGLWIIPDFNYL
ncbi:c6 zinc finger domain-containing protein [Fusarium phyllophilum]|uniref:C6 zinc finger domain-containing protein n=1 Tax=Fusarium phyllophilum TaxID=47803 RepID=A0A8H5IEA5_9HYPO|nr:c6 zinc finger domain-containing protein [Fusarium phyllophilum]